MSKAQNTIVEVAEEESNNISISTLFKIGENSKLTSNILFIINDNNVKDMI